MTVQVRAFGSAPSRAIPWNNASMAVSCLLSLVDHATEHLGGRVGIEGFETVEEPSPVAARAEARQVSGGVGSRKKAS
jgi:hypothetical protein